MYTVERWQRGHMGHLDKYVEESLPRDDAFLKAGELMGSIKAIHGKEGEFSWVEVKGHTKGRMFRSKMVDSEGNVTMALYTIMVYEVEVMEPVVVEMRDPMKFHPDVLREMDYEEDELPSQYHG